MNVFSKNSIGDLKPDLGAFLPTCRTDSMNQFHAFDAEVLEPPVKEIEPTNPTTTPAPSPGGVDRPEDGGPEIPGSGNIYTGGAPGGKGRAKRKPPVNDAVIGDFVSQLREFRALQEELAPWTTEFRERNGRKPTVVDVELTGEYHAS
jgi:hypothetical protein